MSEAMMTKGVVDSNGYFIREVSNAELVSYADLSNYVYDSLVQQIAK